MKITKRQAYLTILFTGCGLAIYFQSAAIGFVAILAATYFPENIKD